MLVERGEDAQPRCSAGPGSLVVKERCTKRFPLGVRKLTVKCFVGFLDFGFGFILLIHYRIAVRD